MREAGEIFVEPCEGIETPSGSLLQLIAPVCGLDCPASDHHGVSDHGEVPAKFSGVMLVVPPRRRRTPRLLDVDDFMIAALPHRLERLRSCLNERFEVRARRGRLHRPPNQG